MSNVIPFRKPLRAAARAEPVPSLAFRVTPTVTAIASTVLTVAEIRDLTEFDFPANFCANEGGTLVLEPADWQQTAQYFSFHGLKLPNDADAQTTYDLWRELRLVYGQAVRLASQGREHDLASVCDSLTPDQRGYAVAVGIQDRPLAGKLARGLFHGRHLSLFLT